MSLWKTPPGVASVAAGISYLAILLVLLIREMYGVGTAEAGDTLTEVTAWIAWKVPWAGALVMGFLTWLWLHFARRILPRFLQRRWGRACKETPSHPSSCGGCDGREPPVPVALDDSAIEPAAYDSPRTACPGVHDGHGRRGVSGRGHAPL